ncbi:MAG: hypothetical protein DRJ03_12050 [Chloroflexi bacterium]|nr:MAG: hypothetical protein DRJ03_12050 [Chloroflexota bacterium]
MPKKKMRRSKLEILQSRRTTLENKVCPIDARHKKLVAVYKGIREERIKQIFQSAEIRAVTWQYVKQYANGTLKFHAVKNKQLKALLATVLEKELYYGVGSRFLRYGPVELVITKQIVLAPNKNATLYLSTNSDAGFDAARQLGLRFVVGNALKQQLEEEKKRVQRTEKLSERLAGYAKEDRTRDRERKRAAHASPNKK